MTCTGLKLLVSSALLVAAGTAQGHGASASASIAIVNPTPGAVTGERLTVQLRNEGVAVAPVGINKHKAGHFVLLVNQPAGSLGDSPLPHADGYIHLEAGEGETVVQLPPGRHTLQAVLADEEHEVFDERLVTQRVEFVVEATAAN
jgi:hypothetical protein